MSPVSRLKDDFYSDLDVKFFLDTITEKSNTFYFYGKLTDNVFYLSDNMCDKFGFDNNYVEDFPVQWKECIYCEQDKSHFNKCIQQMYERKDKNINLRFRVRDVNQNVSWIHFYGGVKYDTETEMPIKFVGYISEQDDFLLVDPVTGFPMESYLEEYLEELKTQQREVIGIGIHFKNIGDLNSNRGRGFTNQMMKEICYELNRTLKDKLKFFRLDGPIILALLDIQYKDRLDDIIFMIKKITKFIYYKHDIKIHEPTHVIALRSNMSVTMFMENIYSLFKKTRQSLNELYINGNLGLNNIIDDAAFIKLSNQILQIHEDVINDMNHFRIVIQPIVDRKTEKIVGGETLLRWKYDDKDISPTVFVNILEKQNLIQRVGKWIFEQAVQMCKLISQVDPDFYLSVNVSLLQLSDDAFIPFIKETIQKYDLNTDNIVLEMTESLMDSNPQRVENFVNECNKMGIRLALDDFGTGYSSIAHLFKYETRIIKIDRSLLLEMEVSQERRNFVLSLIHTFKMSGRKIIVEGASTENHRHLLQQSDCDCIQGYYYYHPLEKSDISAMYFR